MDTTSRIAGSLRRLFSHVLGCQQLLLPRGAAQRAVAALGAPCFGPIRPQGQAVWSPRRARHRALSRPGEASVVMRQNLSRPSPPGGYASLDGTCRASHRSSHLAGKKPRAGERLAATPRTERAGENANRVLPTHQRHGALELFHGSHPGSHQPSFSRPMSRAPAAEPAG